MPLYFKGLICIIRDCTALAIQVNRIDLAAAPLTQTPEREDEVKFLSPPFMKFGLAILMRKRDRSPDIRRIADLADQEKIQYGVVSSGSTAMFFRSFRRSQYSKMWSVMSSRDNPTLVDSIEDGVERVRQSTDSRPFVFIGEEYTVKYHASRKPCDLTYVDGNVQEYDGEYHLAVRKNLPQSTVDRLETSLGRLNDSGQLRQLYEKWWVERAECSLPSSSTMLATSAMAILVPAAVAVVLFGFSSSE